MNFLIGLGGKGLAKFNRNGKIIYRCMLVAIIVGYFDRTLTLPRLKMKLTLNQRVPVTS